MHSALFTITAAGLLRYISTSFAHLQTTIVILSILPDKIAQAQSDWIAVICEQQFSSLATDSLGFDWLILRQ